MNPTGKDPLQRKLEIQNWIMLGVLIMISFLFVSYSITLGILCGGLLSIANYYGLRFSLSKAFLKDSNKTKTFLMIRYYARFIATGVILYLLITRTSINVIALIIGLSAVVINIVFTTIVEVLKKNFTLKTKEVN
jgi:hypothetical protein